MWFVQSLAQGKPRSSVCGWVFRCLSLDPCFFHCTTQLPNRAWGRECGKNRGNNKGLGGRCVGQREENPEPDAAEQSA